MRPETAERLHDLARRAGLGGMPLPAAGALAACAGLALVWAAWRWWPSGDVTQYSSTEQGAEASAETAASVPATQSAPAMLVVHVVGAVRHPGVFELPAGSRVRDAVEAAGGLLGAAAPASVNLARLVQDGEQIAVPTQDEAAAGASPGAAAVAGAGASSGPAGGKVNLNTADASALDALPGVGPATAARIIADREANGPFASVDDLARVSGIGAKKLEGLRDLVTVR